MAETTVPPLSEPFEEDGFKPNPDDPSQPLATSLKPLTAATLTVRIIKSFEFRTAKALVMKDVDLVSLTVGGLMDRVREGELPLSIRAYGRYVKDSSGVVIGRRLELMIAIKTAPGFKPYRTLQLGKPSSTLLARPQHPLHLSIVDSVVSNALLSASGGQS